MSDSEPAFDLQLPSDPVALLRRFEGRLTDTERTVVSLTRQWSTDRSAPLYSVGGSVRDLLLRRPHLDLDLAIDGDVAGLATFITERLPSTVTFHPHFGTAVMEGDGWSVDLVRTRREIYAHPAALPAVEPAPIASDLGRRDFSVHAMALPLNGAAAGVILDPFGGLEDIRNGILRVLHPESFRDDPTRILRLARYATRLHFEISQETAQLARRDAAFLAATSPARISHELERTFEEPLPELSLLILRDLRALTSVSPSFRVPRTLPELFERLRSDGGSAPGMGEYLAAIMALWDRNAIQAVVESLQLRADALLALRELPRAMAAVRSLAEQAPDPVDIVRRLDPLPLESVRGVAAALDGAAGQVVRRYLSQWRTMRPLLGGTDLIQLGVPRGPQIGRILEHLRAARLRGEAGCRDDEEAEVQRWLCTNGGVDGEVQ